MQYGLIAEEVAERMPELVIYDKAGQPETVKYQLLSVLLLNELKKEHSLNWNHSESHVLVSYPYSRSHLLFL